MILNETQIKDIVLTQPNKLLILEAVKRTKLFRLHMDGLDMSTSLPKIEGFEDNWLNQLRVKYARSNRDFMARLGRPKDKIFSARGKSLYFNLPESQEKKARGIVKDIRNDVSLWQWMQWYWNPSFDRDPNGFIFMEILPEQQVALRKAQGKSYVYPTTKSITQVHDYLPAGSGLEYVVFKTTAAEKKGWDIDPALTIYRVVDDVKDYLVKEENGDIVILQDKTLPNLFMRVPAMLNSDIPHPSQPGIMLNVFDDIIELCDEFLLKGSIKITHEFMHAFPKYWEYADDCITCQTSGISTGLVEGKQCPSCKGTKKRLNTSVSDVKLLAHPESKDTPLIAPNVAGYVSPDKVFFDMSTMGQQFLEDLAFHTTWGTESKVKTAGMSLDAKGGTQDKTATQVMDDMQPKADRLHPLSDMASKRFRFIVDMALTIQINQRYKGCSMSYGKRYLFEGPDKLWEKYLDSKKKGASMAALDDLLIEYYEARFNSDPVKLEVMLKLMKVEPFVHMSASELRGLQPDEQDYVQKVYFGEWVQNLTELEILAADVEALRTLLATYCATKKVNETDKMQFAAKAGAPAA